MSLARKTVRGALWTISASFGARALGLVGTLVLTRFLSPTEYGEVTIAVVLLLTANQVSTAGTGQYLVAKPDAGRAMAFHALAYHVLFGALALALVLASGEWLTEALEAPRAVVFLPALAFSVVLDRIGYVPERILVRDMRFGVLSGARTIGELTYSVASVLFAVLGWGATAVVIGNVVRSAVKAGIFTFSVERRDWFEPCAISWTKTRQLFGFGLPISAAAIMAFASRRWDNLLISRFFGPGPTGVYNLAYNLADVPAIQVGEQIGDVLLPSFARMEAAQRKRAFIRSLALLALVVFPLAVGLGMVAPTLVALLFDPRWHDVAPMLLLLSALSVTRPVSWVVSSYLQAQQVPRLLMVLELFKVVFLLSSIATLGRLSPLWACGAVGLAFAIHMVACLWTVQRLDSIPLSHSLASLGGPLLACLPMSVAVLSVRGLLGLSDGVPLLLALVAEITAGGLAYLLSALLFVPGTSKELLLRLRDAVRPRLAAAPDSQGS